jgi:hypothetical protein
MISLFKRLFESFFLEDAEVEQTSIFAFRYYYVPFELGYQVLRLMSSLPEVNLTVLIIYFFDRSFRLITFSYALFNLCIIVFIMSLLLKLDLIFILIILSTKISAIQANKIIKNKVFEMV